MKFIKERFFQVSILFFGIMIGIFITVASGKTSESYASQNQKSLKKVDDSNNLKKGFIFELNNQLVEIGKKTRPAIVSISTEKNMTVNSYDPFSNPFFNNFFGHINPDNRGNKRRRTFKQLALGSGIIISKDGYILTNNHVIGDADKISVTVYKNGVKDRVFKAKVIGKDPSSDVGLIKINPGDYNLIVAKLGDSDKENVGEIVLAVGTPLGLSQTMTMGIISALHREISLNLYENFIQTDAAINSGNSGGALINIYGQVIGINTAIMSKSGGNQGIGFAIPINMAMNIVEQLKTHGKVKRGWLGISMQALTDKERKAFGFDEQLKGVLIADVMNNSPAKKAGIKRGDVIVEFNNHKILNMNILKNLVASSLPNSIANVKIYRKNRYLNVKVKLAQKGSDGSGIDIPENKDEFYSKRIGIHVGNINKKNKSGVIILSVDDESNGFLSGLRKGDVIFQIGQQDINNVNDFKNIEKKIKHKHSIPFLVKRGKYTMFIIVNIK